MSSKEKKKDKEKDVEELILIYNSSYSSPCSKCPLRGLCLR